MMPDERLRTELDALAEEHRRHLDVLNALLEQEGEAITRQAITKHLHALEEARLVRSTRDGRERIWELRRTGSTRPGAASRGSRRGGTPRSDARALVEEDGR